MILLCTAAFLALMLYAIFSTDASYYYPRLITDQLSYYLKGLWLVEHGNTAARAAVNSPPFFYAAMPGILRAPWIALFKDFDDQLRAIQVSNALASPALAIMSAYIVSWVLPREHHRTAIAVSFALLVLNPVWVTNVLSPLADLPYAAASLAAVIVLTRLITGNDGERRSRWRMALFLALFVIAFGCRFTAPVILVYGIVLARNKSRSAFRSRPIPRRTIWIVAAVLITLVAVNFRTILAGYVPVGFVFYKRVDALGMVLYTTGVGIPALIIPGFELFFRTTPSWSLIHPAFARLQPDLYLLLIGFVVTAVIAVGMWASRRKYDAEIAYVVAPLPVIGAIIQSTSRYLLSYQAFYWMFAIAGACAIGKKVLPGFKWNRGRTLAATLFLLTLGGGLLYARSMRLTPGERVTLKNFSLGSTRRKAPAVAATFRHLRQFIETLPQSETLIIGEGKATGQWTVIARRDHFHLDSTVVTAAATKKLFLILWCATRKDCEYFDDHDAEERSRISKFGRVRFTRVFEESNVYSTARVYRVEPAG